MKVWYISKYALPPIEGNYSRHFFLAKELVKLGDQVTLIYSRSNGKKSKKFWGLKQEKKYSGVSCMLINGPEIKLGLNVKRIFSWIIFEINLIAATLFTSSKNRPDVIIASSLSILTFLSAVWLKIRFRSKMVLEVRDIWPDTLIESGRFSKKNIFIRFLYWVENYGYKHADGIMATMPKFDEYLKNKSDKIHKFVCIPQGVDLEYIDATKPVYNPAFKENHFNVCYAGAIGVANYVQDFLDAAKILQYNTSLHFVIIGDGPLKKKYEEEYGYLKNISFAPAVPRAKIVGHLLNADLLVNLWGDKSIYRYGVSPNKWIDYMLSERPILVAYNGFRSIINEADCGLFIQANRPDLLAETILKMSHIGKKELEEMGKRGRLYVLEHLKFSTLSLKLQNFIHDL